MVQYAWRVPAVLFVNPRSGSGRPSADELVAEAEARGVRVRLLGEGDDLDALARETEADALGMAGGDGSLAAVAAAAVERDLPFAVVPFGTRNHFARDLGLDRDDPVAALDAFVDGVERRVDVGRVGEQLFLNNVSLGDYATLVHRRERHRRRRDALARARAYWILLRDRGDPPVLSVDGDEICARIVLVGNNAYSLDVAVDRRARARRRGAAVPVRRARADRRGRGRSARARDSRSTRSRTACAPRSTASRWCSRRRSSSAIEPGALRVLLPPGVEDERDVRERERVGRG